MKDLPYFKFYPAEWLAGEIAIEDYEAQGKYLNLCCVYWSKQGQITVEQARKRVGEALDLFIEIGVVKIDKSNVKITFLDEQLDERNKLCKQNSANVKKRYAKTSTSQENPTGVENRTTDKSTVVYNKEKRREEESRVEKIREDKIREEIVLPYQEEAFADAWREWKDYKKKEHRFTFKNPATEQRSLMQLSSECTARGAGAELAIKSIHASIAKGWKGIYLVEEKGIIDNNHDIDKVLKWANGK
jgi:DNA polymerase sigma